MYIYAINNIIYIFPSNSYNLETRLTLYSDFEEFYLPLFLYYAIRYYHLDHDEPITNAPYTHQLIVEPLDLDYVNISQDNAVEYNDVRRINTNKNKVNLVRTPTLLDETLSQESPKK